MTAVRVEQVVTSGVFHLDGGTWNVDNNVWLIGTDTEVLVIDAAHDATIIAAAVGARRLLAIACTHAHDDHVSAAPALSALLSAPVLLHGDDRVLWDLAHPHRPPDGEITDGGVLHVAEVDLHAVATPGHSPGGVCYYSPQLEAVFTGDTLFQGGPGATGRSFSDFPTIIASISERLLTLPSHTTVYPGHGPATTISAETPHLEEWVARGH